MTVSALGEDATPSPAYSPEREGSSGNSTLPLVLCIEDDPECAALIREELEERGFRVKLARDGREGLAALCASPVDVVLADINMPKMSGFELLRELGKLPFGDSCPPFIFLTGQGDRETEIGARKLGADDYVRKPVDFDILQAIISARIAGIGRLRAGSSSGSPLSDREKTVLTWAARGKTCDEIANIVGVSSRTVEFHLDNARNKLGVSTRIEAAVKATMLRIIPP